MLSVVMLNVLSKTALLKVENLAKTALILSTIRYRAFLMGLIATLVVDCRYAECRSAIKSALK